MKRTLHLFAALTLLVMLAACSSQPANGGGNTVPATTVSNEATAQTGEPWTAQQLMPPADLAAKLSGPEAARPAVFDIGPSGVIKGATEIGPTNEAANMERLRAALSRLPKDRPVVIYCGCCPFRNCPNVRPAFNLLKEMGFAQPNLLNLPTNLKVDWIDKGYPMQP